MQRIQRVIDAYDVGSVQSITPFGNGHINDTYLITSDTGRYVLQRINTEVFKDPVGLMENVCAVTEHVAARIRARGGNPDRETLRVIPTRDGKNHVWNESGFWRMTVHIADSVSHDTTSNSAVLESAGRAFGVFVMDLGDFPADTLHETIPMFHHTPNRLRQLRDAVANDAAGRAASVQQEIDAVLAFAEETAWLTDHLADGSLPLRVTHNDTKLNNILFDAATDEGLCVVDLDTVMPGLLAYDFGDAIRVAANTADEGDPDVSHVGVNLENFAAFTRGILSAVPDVITENEVQSLVMGAKLMSWEVASRFLADYLNGDVYFRIHYPTQNLDRARNQTALVQAIHAHQAEMEEIVAQIWREVKREGKA